MASALSIPIAAAVSWALGAVWYNLLGPAWLEALGKTREELMGASDKPSPLPFVLSFAAELVMATVLAILIGALGLRSAAGGMSVGIMAWVGFVATTVSINQIYSGQKPSLFLIDAGHWLAVLLVQGFIIGALA